MRQNALETSHFVLMFAIFDDQNDASLLQFPGLEYNADTGMSIAVLCDPDFSGLIRILYWLYLQFNIKPTTLEFIKYSNFVCL